MILITDIAAAIKRAKPCAIDDVRLFRPYRASDGIVLIPHRVWDQIDKFPEGSIFLGIRKGVFVQTPDARQSVILWDGRVEEVHPVI